MALPVLWIVIPCYNTQLVLPITAPRFLKKLTTLLQLKRIAQNSRVLFVEHGSKDRNWSYIQEFSQADDTFTPIQQSHYRGTQNAVLAGLNTAKDH